MRDREELPRVVREIRDTWIPMPDGTRLSARMWMPEDADSDPVPGILELLPYRKSDGTAIRDARNARWFAGHGYAVVRVDIRGTGNSEGTILDEYPQQEIDDGVACVSWIAQQGWCTGRVGIMGISWGGFNGLQIAAQGPPELHAVLSLCSTDDRYADDVHYLGGSVLADYMVPWATTMLGWLGLPPEPEVVGPGWRDQWVRRLEATPPLIERWLTHQRRDDYWKHGSICEDPAAIRCPVYLVGGWVDAYRDAILRMLESLDVPRRGLIGPWSHAWPHFAEPGPQVGFLQDALRWWDRWLKKVPNGIDEEPMLLSWMQESAPPRGHYSDRPGRWVADPSWPSPNIKPLPVQLQEGQALLPESGDPPREAAGSVDITSVQSHGVLGGRSCSYGQPYDLPVDQRSEDSISTCFDSEPFTERLEIQGTPHAELTLSADRPVALVTVRVCDVAPDGTSTLLTRGVLNLTHRDSHEHPTPLEPGRSYPARFPLRAIAHTVPAGHRLRVAVAPACWPLVWPTPEPVTLSLHWPGSHLVLPTRVGGEDGTFPFADPEQARIFPHEPLEVTDIGTVTRDLATGKVSVLNANGGGYCREELGTQTRYCVHQEDVFDIHDDDPTTATATARRTYELSRGEMDARVDADATMTADVNTFHVHTKLTARDGNETVFQREWRFDIPRDLG